MFHKLAHEYRSNNIGNREYSAALGTAVGQALTAYFLFGGIPGFGGGEPIDQAKNTFQMNWSSYGTWGVMDKEYPDGNDILDHVIPKIFASPVLTEFPFTINSYMCEYPLGQEYGNARPDILFLGAALPGVLTPAHVVDFKFKLTLDKKYRESTIADYGTSEQAMFYPWAVSEKLNVACKNFYICLIVAKPFSMELINFPVDPEAQALWLEGRRKVWANMAADNVWMSDTHSSRYGPCEFKKACLDYKLDQDLMRLDYTRIEDTRNEAD